MSGADGRPLLQVRDLRTWFPVRSGPLGRRGGVVRAVDGVDLEIREGETLGLVGESGCGKSTLGRSILRLIEPTGGEVIYRGEDLLRLSPEAMRRKRREVGIVFQDPYASLDPRQSVGDMLAEPLDIHGLARSERQRRQRIAELLHLVGLDPRMTARYPHEFSGGQRQRLAIARALAVEPSLLVCDEAVSALDVSIQAQIINLLKRLQEELRLTYLFIAHDLAVVKHISERIAVMYLGRVVETAPSSDLYAGPQHPYTASLLSAVPVPDPKVERLRRRIILTGEVPSPLNPPSGCHFRTRCFRSQDRCAAEAPELLPVGTGSGSAACFYPLEGVDAVAR